MKSGNLNFLEPSGPVQACNGTALPFSNSSANYVSVVKLLDKGPPQVGRSQYFRAIFALFQLRMLLNILLCS